MHSRCMQQCQNLSREKHDLANLVFCTAGANGFEESCLRTCTSTHAGKNALCFIAGQAGTAGMGDMMGQQSCLDLTLAIFPMYGKGWMARA